MGIPENLTRIRKSLGLTTQQVAAPLGISRQAYANYEHGTILPNYNRITKLARMFNVSVSDIIGDEPDTDNDLKVNSTNPMFDRFKADDKFNELTDFEKSVLLMLRLLPKDGKAEAADYISKLLEDKKE